MSFKIQTQDAELGKHVNPALTEGMVSANQTSLAMVKAKIEKESGLKVALSVNEAERTVTVKRSING